MAGKGNSPIWWAMKRAKNKRTKRKNKKAASSKPGGHEGKPGEGKLPTGVSSVGHSQTVLYKSAPQESERNKHEQLSEKSSGDLEGPTRTADSLGGSRQTANVGGPSIDRVGKPPPKTQAVADQMLSTEEMLKTLSKQARKRRLKRLREKQNKQTEKEGFNSSKTSTGSKLGKDKETERKEAPSKKRPKQFKKKKQSKAAKEVVSPPDFQLGGGEQLGKSLPGDDRLESGRTLKRKERTEHEMKKKRVDEDANKDTGHVTKKEEQKAASNENRQNNPGAVGGVDTNWLNLMKTIEHGPHRKKLKKDSGRPASTAEQTEKPEIWFDDVDPILLNESGAEAPLSKSSSKALSEDHGNTEEAATVAGLTKYMALDCEMVGIGPGGKESMLARVSLVNQHCTCIYDKYVAPQEDVTQYRTSVSGITPANLVNAEEFTKVQEEVSNILKGRILIGHALHNDLKVLFLNHPKSMMRDTSTYKPFRELCQGHRPSLKKLCELILKVKIQEGEHNSVEDAQAVMNLFLKYRKKWEEEARKMLKRWKKKTEAAAVDSP